MDIETSEAIETLRGDLRRVETTLSAKIDTTVQASASTLWAEMHQMRKEMADMRLGMADMRLQMTDMRLEMTETRAESKTNAQVLFESLRDDIRMIAEGLVSLDRKVESIRRPTGLQ